ncbi:MAG: NAD(P)H-binding protein [Burkholderiaceae bacterium]
MKIGILGASGVLGRALASLLRREGVCVRAIVRDPTRAPMVDEVATADILEPRSLPAALADLDVVVNLATSIPNGRGCGDWAVNDRIRLKGTRHLLDGLAKLGGSCRLVQQSVAMLHRGDQPSDESGELVGEGILASAVVMEAAVQGSSLDWVIVRGAALCGPGTSRDEAFFERMADGRLREPEESSRWISLVHVYDLAAAFALATGLQGGRAYIAADECPRTYTQMFAAVRGDRAADANAPRMAPLPSFRVQAGRLRAAGWRPAYPDVLAELGRSAVVREIEKVQTP